MKKILWTVFLSLCFFIPPVYASTNTYERTSEDYRVEEDIVVTEKRIPYIMSTPSVDASEKVYDFANLFSDIQEQELYTQIQEFIERTKYDFVLVTIDINPKVTKLNIRDKDYADVVYADDFYDYNDFGYGNTRDGLLLLIDMDNRYVYLGGSGDAQYLYTDYECEEITGSIYSYLSDAHYMEGVKQTIEIAKEYYISVEAQAKAREESTPIVDTSQKIYDFANLFTEEERQELYTEIETFIRKTKFDLAIVTISENPKIEALGLYNKNTADKIYAEDFYYYNHFGYEGTEDGLLILIDIDNSYLYLDVSGQAQAYYTDQKCDRIEDAVYKYLTNKEYAFSMRHMIKILDSYYKLGKKSDRNYIIAKDGTLKRDYHIPVLAFISSVITFIIILVMVFKNRMVNKAITGERYLNKESTQIRRLKDTLIDAHTSRIYAPRSESSGGGGSSSGGGGHTSSSGSSHSGGGHHF